MHRGVDIGKPERCPVWLRSLGRQLALAAVILALASVLFILFSLLFHGHVNW